MKQAITGQLFFRETGGDAPTNDGRKLWIVTGILAFSAGSEPEPESFQAVRISRDWTGNEVIVHQPIKVPDPDGKREDWTLGSLPGQLLLKPIWRV